MCRVFAGIGLVGEMVVIQNVSRYCDDVYECVASNGVPPSVSRKIRVTVECTLISLNSPGLPSRTFARTVSSMS